MSWNGRRTAIVVAIAGVTVAGAGVAVAANGAPWSPKEERQAVIDDAAKQLGVQPQALADALKKAALNRVDAAVAAGRLTKEQGDELKARIEAGGGPLLGLGPGRGHGHDHGFGGPMHGGPFGLGLDAAAAYLGVTEAALRAQLESGKSLADVAKAQGKTVDGLVQALADAAKKRLDAAVASGRLTRAQADAALAELKEHLSAVVQGTGPRLRGHHRQGPPGMAPGMMF